MKTSKKLKEVFDKVRPHIDGHRTVINEFIDAIHEVEEMEALSQHDVSVSDCISKNEVLHYMDIDTVGACSKCGSMKQYEH